MNPYSTENQGDKILKERGIFDQAMNAKWDFRWYRGAFGWSYPIIGYDGNEIARRWKAIDDINAERAGCKYAWDGGKPNHPDANWYYLGPITWHIKENQGVCYIANGEPALLAYHAGGVPNVIATTAGENTIPDDTVSRCKQLGITRLIYPYDNDDAGRKSASKWRDAIAGSGIDFEALTFEEILPDKADANDLWIDVKFNASEFQYSLECLPTGRLLGPRKKVEYGRYNSNTENNGQLADAIASHFGLTGGRVRQGFYAKKVHCPFHDDNHASAGIAADSGVLHCFSNCGVIDPMSVASFIGIDTSRYHTPRKNIVAPSSIKAQALEDCTELIPKLHAIMQSSKTLMTYGDQKIVPNTLATLYIIRQNILDNEPVTMGQLSAIETAKQLI